MSGGLAIGALLDGIAEGRIYIRDRDNIVGADFVRLN
jgi:hypothetical protein